MKGGEIMREEKVKAFVARIVEECEQEGLTMDEALSVPQLLRFKLSDRAAEIRKRINLSGLPVDL